MGEVGKRRVPLEAYPVWRTFPQTCAASLRDALSPRAESPGQGQLAALPIANSTE
jgi:hypothetical protein